MNRTSFYLALTVLLVLAAIAIPFSSLGVQGSIWVVLIILFLALFFLGPGILSGLLSFIPPLRRSARRTASVRKRLLVVFGLLGFALEFSLLIYTTVFVLVGNTDRYMSYDDATKFAPYNGPAAGDIWRREILPPPLRTLQPSCYSEETETCRLVEIASHNFHLGSSEWNSYLFAGLFSIPSLIISLLVASKIMSTSVTTTRLLAK